MAESPTVTLLSTILEAAYPVTYWKPHHKSRQHIDDCRIPPV
ncbi:MAG: hypothetical protein QW056_03775 [Candidatus Bathyarchaeia archaeon]